MLYIVDKLSDSRISLFRDDPVRPEISADFRCSLPDNCVFVLEDNLAKPLAVLCCSFKDYVPSSMDQLLYISNSIGKNAIFYSVWSYSKGSGRRIIPLACEWIKANYSLVKGFYTYSPKGQSVRDFHFSLGASIFRENFDSVNYQYSNF